MDSSQYLKLQLSNAPKFVRYNPPSQDSSTQTWKKQLQAAGGTQNNHLPQSNNCCPKPEEISNRYVATTVGANSDYYNIMLYKAGQQTCGSNFPMYQYISSTNTPTPLNPILGQNPAGVENTFFVPRSLQFKEVCDSSGDCVGKGMIYPSG